jgi:hypothetical protein
MRRMRGLRGLGDGFPGQPSNSWNQFPIYQPVNPGGAGFAGPPSNYWSQLSNQRVQLVMAPGFLTGKLVAKSSLSGWRGLGRLRGRGLRGLGDCPAPYTDLGDGCCYDDDGNRLTCAGGIAPSPAGTNNLNLPQAPTITAGAASQNTVVPWTTPPPPPPQPTAWDQIVAWLGQTTIPGLKNGYLLAGVALLPMLTQRKGRRRR